MSTLKAGDVKKYDVAGVTLFVEAIPLGKLKKIIKIIVDIGVKFDKKALADDFLTIVPDMVASYIDQLIPLLFIKDKHPFLTQDWVDENLTVPVMKQILVDAITVNGLGDFFLKTVKGPAPKPVDESGSSTTETSSEKSGSITSSESPTDGDLKT